MEEDCKDCYKIKCGKCEWEASNEEMAMVQKGILTNCPLCSWSPKEGN